MPFFLFHFFVTCLGTAQPRANRPEVPCRIPECSGKALRGQEVHGHRVCPCPRAPAGVSSLRPPESLARKRRGEPAFCWVSVLPSSVKCLLQPSSESPKEATTKRPKERQGFEPEGMSVHTCTHRRLPKLPVNSALLPRWFALWQQGSLSLSVSPVHLGHHVCPQHCAGQGTSLFCLGR